MISNTFKAIICPECKNYPLITLNNESLKEVLIQCNHCKYNQSYNLHDYLNLIEVKQINDNDKLCNEHKLKYNYYCNDCQLHICNECNNHQLHQLISLNDIITTDNLTNRINNGYNFINNYCNKLKVKLINEYITMINKLEYSYNIFKIKNTDILDLIQIIINNYENNTNNYIFKTNLININNNHINLYQYHNKISLVGIISYFNNYILIEDNSISVQNVTKFQNIKTINEQNDWINSPLLLSDGRLALCSYDTIKIYNINNNYHCDIIIEHTKCVNYISQLDNNKLISCSFDKAIKIWSITQSSYQCDYTMEGAHDNYITKVISLPENRFASCSWDSSIKIWNSNDPYKLIQTLKGHTDHVNSIIFLKGKDKLISGGNDNYICIWNISTYKCEIIMKGVSCSYSNGMIEIDNNTIMVGGEKTIVIINVDKNRIERKIKQNNINYVYSLMKLRDGKILCGCKTGVLGIYNIKLNNFFFPNHKAHKSTITDLLRINTHQFISCSPDNTIKVWDY